MVTKWNYENTYNPEDYLGFVYKITNKTNNKFYIGKKYFWYNKKKKLTKKQLLLLPSTPGRKPTFEIVKVESDWEKYWGSSKELITDVKKLGDESFECVILRLCKSKKELTYYEMHYQCINNCIIPGINTYNDNILGKFFSKDLA
jgi:hypothetical protein